LGILSSGNLPYDPSILLKVTSLFSTVSKRKDAKKLFQKEFEKDIFKKNSMFLGVCVKYIVGKVGTK
jgi:hypothetical protein